LYGIVGNPVSQSPRIHNAAYLATEQPAIFVPLEVEGFAQFWQSFVVETPLATIDIDVRGLTVASPHKESASERDGAKSEIVQAACSGNLLYRCNGKWRVESTDPDDVLLNLRATSIRLASSNVAVVGCGGSGRAIVAALKQEGSREFNRNPIRGRRVMQLLDLPLPLSEFRADAFSVVINATSVGRDGRSCPVDLNRLRDDTVVVDLVYGSDVTPLVEFARARGLKTFDGRDILCTQVTRQFQRMTGRQMPLGLAEEFTHRSRLLGKHALPSLEAHTPSISVEDEQ
jgi:shikimate 5-dehydrogenase